MRKLLVASQKSGVGKTTTSINLAAAAAAAGARVLLVETDPLNNVSAALNLGQHPDRKPLRETGVELPGVLCRGVVPGLDVFSPYEEGGCPDEDLDRLLHLLSMDVLSESYDCLIVNAPPFFGGRPIPLLASCDEFLVVMQAEPMAYRTMPAFLEMVQRAGQAEPRSAKMRGILLTLPDSESPGGRWERELRGRFGGRVLPQVIPYDEEVGKAGLFGHVLVHASPESPAATAYQACAGELQLAKDVNKSAARSVESALTMAAAAVLANPPTQRAAPYSKRKSSARIPRVRIPAPVGTTLLADPPVAPPEPVPAPWQPERPAPAPVRAIEPAFESDPQPEPPPAPLHSSQRPWFVWVGLAVATGLGLRFVQLPDFALPMIVGLAVTAGVTLSLHLLMQSAAAAGPVPKPADGTEPHKPQGRRV